MNTVWLNGCFDLLHDGHKHLLLEARRLAGKDGKVYVALNSDDSVRRLKGDGRPMQTWFDRVVALSEYADGIVSFSTEEQLYEIYRRMKPDILVKGNDYSGKPITGYDWCKRIVLVERLPFSTSSLIGAAGTETSS